MMASTSCSTVIPRGFRIPFFRVPGLMSLWFGTIATRPSGCCNFTWLPFWLTISKPSLRKALISSAPESCGSLGTGKFDGNDKLTFVVEILSFGSHFGILKVELDRLLDIFQRLLESFPLRCTSWQVGYPNGEP